MSRDIEVIEERIKQIQPFLSVTDEYNDEYNALQAALSLMEQMEKVGNVLPKNPYFGGAYGGEIWNACLHQVKLILAKKGLVRKPTVGEIAFIIKESNFPFFKCIAKERRDEACFDIAQAIIAKLEGEGK